MTVSFFFAGCTDNDPHLSYSYLRAAADFSVDTASTDTLCADPGPNFIRNAEFDPTVTCRNTKKFVLRWERPEDTVEFRGYRLYLDTTPGDVSKPWLETQKSDRDVAVTILETAKQKDGLVFFFYDRNKIPPGIVPTPRPDTLKPGNRRIFGLDTLERLEMSQNRFIFALATRYGGDRAMGQPQYVRIITGDKGVPAAFNPLFTPGSDKLDVTWARPNDPTSFFNPTADTGIISGYYLKVRFTGKNVKERIAKFSPKLAYWKGDVKQEEGIRDSVLIDGGNPIGRGYFLPDWARARRGAPVKSDSLRVQIQNLVPQETYDVSLYAVDSAGNENSGSMPKYVSVILTDTSQPSTPDLQVDTALTTKNSFLVRWSASRDSVEENGDGVLEARGSPNFRIAEYRLSRILVRGPGEKADAMDRRDTVIAVTEANAGDSSFVDSVRFLPPGKTYLLRLTAIDKSGYLSKPDSAMVTTDSILFVGGDSGLTCPAGFVPIPSSTFILGDSTQGGADEKGENGQPRRMRMGAYCIEPFEHRDSLGGFATKVTWREADSICQAVSPTDSTMLCSEVEWERACEGFDPAAPHLHGIQSERSPGILQASCNQGTGDSVMAMSFELRNPVCLTNEGVYDMAGNLSEWVRDPYNPKAYSLNKDTVMSYGFTFPSAGSGDSATVHSIRGGNYLKPTLATAQVQALARCSNRDFPMQVRPVSKPECIDPVSVKIAVIYSDGLAGVKCFPIPDELKDIVFSDILPDRDSSKVRYFIAGTTRSDVIPIPLSTPADSIFRGRKPLRVELTKPSLAEVVFQRVGNAADSIVDTLDAREMRDTSQSALRSILRRESPSAAWAPKEENGRVAVRKLYAYMASGSKVAKTYYASRNIGFRCCSRPRPAAKTPAMASSP